MNIQEILDIVRPIKGWFSDQQMTILYPYINRLLENSLLVEIGSFHGRSTLFFRLSNPTLKVLTIDPCKPYTANGRIVYPPYMIDDEVMKYGNIFQVVDESVEVARRFTWNIDCLFIDGNHEQSEVLKDVTAWIPKLRPRTLVIMHDYDPEHPGVIFTVEFLRNQNKLNTLYADQNTALYIAETK